MAGFSIILRQKYVSNRTYIACHTLHVEFGDVGVDGDVGRGFSWKSASVERRGFE